MRFTVTALGSAGDKPVPVVVGQVARYLLAPDQLPAPAGDGHAQRAQSGEVSVGRYYADRGDSPGRWLGRGARELGLPATVELDAFTNVLGGRDPRTGTRLITARGSTGRVASLGTGTVARRGPQDEALYAVADVAAVLGWSQRDVRHAMAAGERHAASRWVAAVTATAIPAGTGMPGPSDGRPGRATRTADRGGDPDRDGGRDDARKRPGRRAGTSGRAGGAPGHEAGAPAG